MFLYMPMHNLDHESKNYKYSLILLLGQNLMFMLTVLSNQGMISRDPTKHDESYLREIIDKNLKHLTCTKCLIVFPQGSSNVYHCSFCDVCTEGHDHHCVWCSKCIAKGNMFFFSAFLFMTLCCVLGFWFNMISLILYQSPEI